MGSSKGRQKDEVMAQVSYCGDFDQNLEWVCFSLYFDENLCLVRCLGQRSKGLDPSGTVTLVVWCGDKKTATRMLLGISNHLYRVCYQEYLGHGLRWVRNDVGRLKGVGRYKRN